MIIKKLLEAGYEEAMLGLSLSYNQDPSVMPEVAKKLYSKGMGHNKFLESLVVWIDLTASRYFWQQFDTYRVGMSKQSESTMHTMMRSPLTADHFEDKNIELNYLEYLNHLINTKQFQILKGALPEGFLQRRVLCTNYMCIRNIMKQRLSHKLPEWKRFCIDLYNQLDHKEFLGDIG